MQPQTSIVSKRILLIIPLRTGGEPSLEIELWRLRKSSLINRRYLRGLQIGEVEDFENCYPEREIMREDAEKGG